MFKKSKMKFGLSLVALLAIFTLVGCGEAAGDADAGDYIDVSLLFRELPESPWQDDWRIVELIRENHGINFAGNTVQFLNDDFAEQRQLLIGAGNAPEIMPFMYGQYVAQFVPGGQLLPLDDYMEHFPYFNYFLDAWGLRAEWEAHRQEGRQYWLPGLFENVPLRFTVAVRGDILEDLGLAVPETWCEFRDVLRAVQAAHPDAIPFNDAWGWYATSNVSARTFDVRFGWGRGDGLVLDWNTNTHQHVSQMEEMRTFVEYWHSLVDEGLLYRESFVWDFMYDAWANFSNGYAFAVSTNGAPMDESLQNDMIHAYENDLMTGPLASADARILTLATLNGPSGRVGQSRLNNGLVLARSLRDRPEAEFVQILNFVDWFFFSEEGREFALWGVEGETFEWVDGMRQLKEGYTHPGWGQGGNAEMADEWTHIGRDMGFAENAFLPTQGGSDELVLSFVAPAMREILAANMQRIPHEVNPSPPFDVIEQERAAILQGQLNDALDVAVREFVLGIRPMSEWDAFVEESQAAAEELVEMANEAHVRERVQ